MPSTQAVPEMVAPRNCLVLLLWCKIQSKSFLQVKSLEKIASVEISLHLSVLWGFLTRRPLEKLFSFFKSLLSNVSFSLVFLCSPSLSSVSCCHPCLLPIILPSHSFLLLWFVSNTIYPFYYAVINRFIASPTRKLKLSVKGSWYILFASIYYIFISLCVYFNTYNCQQTEWHLLINKKITCF